MENKQGNVKVAVRVRPYNRKELEQGQKSVIKVIDRTTLVFDPEEDDDAFFFQGVKQNYRDITKRVHKKLSMSFDRVFDTNVNNEEIFNECTVPLVDSVLDGYNCSVFVYGATGAGKTFTMLGNENYPGLIFLTMRDLFDKIASQSNIRKFDVAVSYLEVYNEQVINLLDKSGPLKLREDTNGVIVTGLALKPIYNADDLLQLLLQGNSNRTQHPTDANAESSRSHAIFQVHIRITEIKAGMKRMAKLSMIDLAGSERAASTQGMGPRFKEGASINKSLLALGNCINKLADGLKHIPYRDSNLTRILKDSLGGKCQTLMVVNVSMSALTYEDTYNTLKYASRAKRIRTNLRQNILKSNMPKDFYINKVTELVEENEGLKQTIQNLEHAQKSSLLDENEVIMWFTRIDNVITTILQGQSELITLKSLIKTFELRIRRKIDFRELHQKTNNIQNEAIDYKTSMLQLNEQIDKLKSQTTNERHKLDNAYKDLQKLLLEISSTKYSNILQLYIKSKNMEIKNSKQYLLRLHTTSIVNDVLKFLVQHCELMKSNKTSTELHYHIDKLQEYLICAIYKAKSPESSTSIMHSNCLRKDYIGNDGVSTPIKIRKLHVDEFVLDDVNTSDIENDIPDYKTWSESAVATTISKNDLNTTFYMNANTNALEKDLNEIAAMKENISFQKANFVEGILSHQAVTTRMNQEKLKNALLKSTTFTHDSLTKTLSSKIHKDIRKFSPHRIRKSPRLVLAGINERSNSRIKHQPTKMNNQNSTAPLVRSNRAAALRTKK